MPGYVKSKEELENIQQFMSKARFTGQELGITFQTTWAFAREVLPPHFEPLGSKEDDVCEAYACVANYQSAYCGEFDGAIVMLMCTHEGIEGYWMLTEIMSGDLAISTGREMLGEIKKEGTGRIWKHGDSYRAVGARRGIDVFTIEAEITGEDQAPKTIKSHGFDIKMFPSTNGIGLQYPPLLNIWDITNEYSSYREGTGTLTWGHSKWDPVDTIPIVSTGTATAVEYTNYSPLYDQRPIEDCDGSLLQYLWGRGYDDPTWYPIAKCFEGQDTLNPQPDA